MESTRFSGPWPMRLLTGPKAGAKWLKREVRTLRDQANWAIHGDRWAVSHVQIDGANVTIGGWAIASPAQRRRIGFICDGRPFQTIEYPIARPDVAEAFPRAKHAY